MSREKMNVIRAREELSSGYIFSYSAFNFCEREPANQLLPMSTWIPIIKSLYLFAIAPRTGRTRSSINKTPSGAGIWPNPSGFRGGSHPRRAHARTVGTRWNVLAPPRAADAEVAGSFRGDVTSAPSDILFPGSSDAAGACVSWLREMEKGRACATVSPK